MFSRDGNAPDRFRDFRTTVIGLALAAGIGKLVSGLLCRVTSFDPAILVVATAVPSTAAMLACY